MPSQNRGPEAGLVGPAHVQFVPQQGLAGQVDVQARPARAAPLAVAAQDDLVPQGERGPGGQPDPHLGAVPGPGRGHGGFGQVLQPGARADGGRHPQDRLAAVPAGQGDRGGHRPHPQRRACPHVDPQFQDVAAERARRPADQIYGVGRPAEDERRL